MIVLIPAKRHSSRVPDKNWRPFHGGKSLVEIKIEQVIAAVAPEQVYLSCDDPAQEQITQRYGVNFLLRPSAFASDDTPWPDAFAGMVEQLPVHDNEPVAWVEVTNPLFAEFDELFAAWELNNSNHDSVVLAAPVSKFLLTASGQAVNFSKGRWHAMSQHLQPLLAWDSVCIMRKRDMRYFGYPIGRTPHFHHLVGPAVDIDTPDEFRLAQLLYLEKFGDSPAA